MEHACRERDQAVQHWRGLAERNKHSVEELGKRIVELEAEKSQLEELQGEWSQKAAQLEDMKETLALRDESVAAFEEQVRNLLQEKQELQQTVQDRERELGRVRDDMECVKVQVCAGSTYMCTYNFHFCSQ